MSEIKLACDVVKQVRAICDKHGNQPGELINILHEAQHLHGYLPEEIGSDNDKCFARMLLVELISLTNGSIKLL